MNDHNLYIAHHGINKLYWDGAGFKAADSRDAIPLTKPELDALHMKYANVQFRTTQQQFAWDQHYIARPADTEDDQTTLEEGTYASLCADLAAAEEHYGEIDTQYRSECALYGDAWPGAALDRDRAWKIVVALRRQVEQHPDAPPPAAHTEYDDLPF